MISFSVILPELNDFISDLGGADLKGLIYFLFSITAALSRPFSGKLSDTIGRKKVMIMGVIVASIVSLIYPLTGLFSFLVLRFIHGISAGFLPTGATALITDILPEDRRGIGMGIWGTFISVGIGSGQFFSSWIVDNWGLNSLFMVGTAFTLLAGIMISFLSETLPQPQRFKTDFIKVSWNEIFEPNVRPAATVMFCSAISTGIVFVVTPDLSTFLGISNKGWFFGFYMISTILIRLFASSLSDKIGRRPTLVIGMSFMAISMTTIAFSTEWIMYTIGAILFGVSTGISSPTLFAWTADLSTFDRRGIGAGTLFIALEGGIMAGSTITLISYDNTLASLLTVFLIGVVFALTAIFFLIWHLQKRNSKT